MIQLFLDEGRKEDRITFDVGASEFENNVWRLRIVYDRHL